MVQGALGILAGVNLIRGAATLGDIADGVNLAGALHSTATGYGIAVVVVGTLLVLAGILIGRPSTIARVVVALWSFAAFWILLAAFFHGGSVLGFVTVVVFASSGGAILPAAAVLTVDAVISYSLSVHPSTYRAFAEHGRPSKWPSMSLYDKARTGPPTARSEVSPSAARRTPAAVPERSEPVAGAPVPSGASQGGPTAVQTTRLTRSPRQRRPKVPGLGAAWKKRTLPPDPIVERSPRVTAPVAQTRDYSPPTLVSGDNGEPADAHRDLSADNESSR